MYSPSFAIDASGRLDLDGEMPGLIVLSRQNHGFSSIARPGLAPMSNEGWGGAAAMAATIDRYRHKHKLFPYEGR